ncbi:MAG: hypothetical protein JOZ18_20230 [Chloroflexi bacterium]|nr:hypothetical protein [Chloroflexota bacterium]
MQLISKHFPALEELAQPQVEQITTLNELNELFAQLLTATSETDARRLFNLPVE